MNENELAQSVFNAGMRIHQKLGPGLLESIYEECLFHELKKKGHLVER